jgi:CBS domain-containing protein
MAEDYPVIGLEDEALQAVELLATRRLPGLIVTDANGKPHSILPASQVVRFLVPRYVQDDPSLARVVDEPIADRLADRLKDKKVSKLLPSQPSELPVVNHDDTLLEIAAIMARLRSPLVAVVRGDEIVGAITASRLLQLAMSPH